MDNQQAGTIGGKTSQMDQLLMRYAIAYGVAQKKADPEALAIIDSINSYAQSFTEELTHRVTELEELVGLSYGSALNGGENHGQNV